MPDFCCYWLLLAVEIGLILSAFALGRALMQRAWFHTVAKTMAIIASTAMLVGGLLLPPGPWQVLAAVVALLAGALFIGWAIAVFFPARNYGLKRD